MHSYDTAKGQKQFSRCIGVDQIQTYSIILYKGSMDYATLGDAGLLDASLFTKDQAAFIHAIYT